jgi:hypothetical protein
MQGQGNSMARALLRDMSSSVFPNHIHERAPQSHIQQCSRSETQPSHSDPAALLTALLNTAPVDLCRVSEEMRAHPDLRALVVRLAAYPSLSPDALGTTLEQAVVVIGIARLRALVYLWSLLRQKRGSNRIPDAREPNSTFGGRHKTFSRNRSMSQKEIAHLSKFLDSLDSDSAIPQKYQAPLESSEPEDAEFLELTDLLVRDIVSFLPSTAPASREQQNSSAAVMRLRKKDSE